MSCPVWTSEQNAHDALPPELLQIAKNLWQPEEALTTFKVSPVSSSIENLLGLLPTLADHHPHLRYISVFGIADSSELAKALEPFGFIPDTSTSDSSDYRLTRLLSHRYKSHSRPARTGLSPRL